MNKNYYKLSKKELLKKIENIENTKYGLVWSTSKKESIFKKFEIYNAKLDSIRKSGLGKNLITEGDNAILLKILCSYGSDLIDFVYIDPPYNTGSEGFMYNDRIVNSDDPYKHSKWLQFMYNRLLMTKYIMKKGSIIAISIDNNEYHNLKLLCDKVFGESNFLNSIVIELTKTQGPKAGHARMGAIVKNYEYILLYGKNIAGESYKVKQLLFNWESWYDAHYVKWINKDGLFLSLVDDYIKKNKNMVEEAKNLNIKISIQNIEKLCELSSIFKKELYKEAGNIYRVSNANMITSIPQSLKDSLIINKPTNWISPKNKKEYILLKSSKGSIDQLQPLSLSLNESNDFKKNFGKTSIRGSLWKGFWKDMMNVEKEGLVKYNNGKKPVRLIKQLMKWFVKDGDVVLDYFAGSGTTAHSVSEFAAENNYKLKFITCGIKENNYNSIEEMVLPRMKNIGEKNFYSSRMKLVRKDTFWEDNLLQMQETLDTLNSIFDKNIELEDFLKRQDLVLWEK